MMPSTLINHSYRTYVFGRAIGELEGVEVDDERLFAAAMLHDTGLVDPAGDADFTLTSAKIAGDVAERVGLSSAASTTMQTAITMHYSPGVNPAAGPVAYLLAAGAGVDVVGLRSWQLPTTTLTDVVHRHPRGSSGLSAPRSPTMPRACPKGALASSTATEPSASPSGWPPSRPEYRHEHRRHEPLPHQGHPSWPSRRSSARPTPHFSARHSSASDTCQSRPVASLFRAKGTDRLDRGRVVERWTSGCAPSGGCAVRPGRDQRAHGCRAVWLCCRLGVAGVALGSIHRSVPADGRGGLLHGSVTSRCDAPFGFQSRVRTHWSNGSGRRADVRRRARIYSAGRRRPVALDRDVLPRVRAS
jgi:hypothetical protein